MFTQETSDICNVQAGEFAPVTGDNLPSCDAVATPLRRQTYVAANAEEFTPVSDGRLPACTVLESPMRRQTFVKRQRDNMRRLGMFPKDAHQFMENQSESGTRLSTGGKWQENANCSDTSTPTDRTTPPLRSATLENLPVTPITPAFTGMDKITNMKASSVNLLDKNSEIFFGYPQIRVLLRQEEIVR